MVVVSHLFFFFQINFREGMTRCESYPPCFGTIYFPIAPLSMDIRFLVLVFHWYAVCRAFRHPNGGYWQKQSRQYCAIH